MLDGRQRLRGQTVSPPRPTDVYSTYLRLMQDLLQYVAGSMTSPALSDLLIRL